MEIGKMLYLSRSDVAACNISLERSLEISEQTYAAHAKGLYEMPPKPGVHPDTCPRAFIHAMPAYLPESKTVGIKWVNVFGHNPQKHGIPSTSGIIVMNDYETGYPVAVMEAGLITAIRTANASGVSAKYNARKDSKVMCVVGTGEQGRGTAISVCHTVPSIEEVKIFDLYPNAMQRMLDEVGPKIKAKITVCKSAEEAICGSDIIVTAAPIAVMEPVYLRSWVKPGALLLPVHSRGWEFEFLRDTKKFIVDDWEQFHKNLFGPGCYYEQDIAAPYCQLGDIINGTKPGRENDEEIIINNNYGIALLDIAMGAEVLKIAKEKGLGKILSLN